jgi:3-oxoacid CoA-transferase
MRSPEICSTVDDAVRGITDSSSIMLPGFGPGAALNLTSALYRRGTAQLTIIANGAGVRGSGSVKTQGDLIADGRVRKLIASFTASPHPSRPGVAEQLAESGTLEVELVPQGTLAERIRAGGAGIPAFYTPTAAGTLLAEGKRHEEFDGRTYIMERALVADYAFIRAWKADAAGNLVFRLAARNYNPIMAMAARCTIVEVEEPILPAGSIPPDQIHTPGVYVDRLVQIPKDGAFAVNRRLATAAAPSKHGRAFDWAGETRHPLTRDQIAATIARYLEPGWVVNLGIGIPTLASNYLQPESNLLLTSENGVMGYGLVAPEGMEDLDVVNAGVDYVLLEPGASVVHHGDSFALIRSGRVDCVVLGAYEVGADGSFANWKAQTAGRPDLGGIGGAMDLAACSKRVFIAMEHTTADGRPRLVQTCTLPVTSPRGVSLVITDLAVVAVKDGQFILLEHAPGYSFEDIQERTGAPLTAGPDLRPIPL